MEITTLLSIVMVVQSVTAIINSETGFKLLTKIVSNMENDEHKQITLTLNLWIRE